MLKIITNPNPILREKSQPMTDFSSPEIQNLISQLAETMTTADGVGLAAPQVGRNIRLIVVNCEGQAIPMLNPVISKKSFFKEWGEEGCLSVPEIFGEVKRSKKITVRYFNPDGEERDLAAIGLLARVIQHEIDHLDGILFIDKARNIIKGL